MQPLPDDRRGACRIVNLGRPLGQASNRGHQVNLLECLATAEAALDLT